jgi:hypothetical protein
MLHDVHRRPPISYSFQQLIRCFRYNRIGRQILLSPFSLKLNLYLKIDELFLTFSMGEIVHLLINNSVTFTFFPSNELNHQQKIEISQVFTLLYHIRIVKLLTAEHIHTKQGINKYSTQLFFFIFLSRTWGNTSLHISITESNDWNRR